MLWGSGGEAPSEKFYNMRSVGLAKNTPKSITQEQINLCNLNVGKKSMYNGCAMICIVNRLDRLRRSKK